MRKLLLFVSLFLISLIGFSQLVDTIPTPTLWYRAENFNDSTQVLYDLSGNNKDITFIQDIRMGDTLINYQDCIISDSVFNSIVLDYKLKDECELTVFSVYRPEASNEACGVWAMTFDTVSVVSISTQDIKDLSNETTIFADSTDNYAVINLLRQKWLNQDIDTSMSELRILGSDSLPYYKGSFSEFIVYDTIMRKEDITKVYTYLAIRYGISIYMMDYMNSAGDTIWNYKENEYYSNEVAGIGKDTILNINQKQSSALGGTSILQIHTGDLSDRNIDNTTLLNQYDFLIWSDNGKDFTFNQADTLPYDYIKGISHKKWKMCRSGVTAPDINTKLKISAPNLPDSTLVFLVINRDPNLDFLVDSSEIIMPVDADTLGNFYFQDIYWDVDRSGEDIFAFQYFDLSEYLENNNYSNQESDEEEELYNLIVDFVENNPEVLEDTEDETNTEEALEIEEIDDLEYFAVYPNPTTGEFSIEIVQKETTNGKVSILDENSRVINTSSLNGSNRYTLNKTISVKGCYLIVFETEDGTETVKLVVK